MIQRHVPPFSSHQTPASSFASSAGSKPCTNRRSAHIDRKATTSPIGVHSLEIASQDLCISWGLAPMDLEFLALSIRTLCGLDQQTHRRQ